MLGIVSDVARIWLARVELQSATEAAATAGVDSWGDAAADNYANRLAARGIAESIGETNTVLGTAITVAQNDNGSGVDNDNNNNADCDNGEVVLGRLSGGVLDATANNPIAVSERAVLVRKTQTIASIWTFLGGTYTISVQAVARSDAGDPRLTEINSLTCP